MSSAGEDRLAQALEQQLPEPYVVYRNAAWLTKRPGEEPRDGEADFVVAHPELGIMVIEVKGGGIRRVGGEWESVDRNGTAHRIKDPFRQVTGEMHSLKRIAEARPDWPAHSVRFCRAVAFPDTTYEQALTPDGPPEIVIDADDLDRLQPRLARDLRLVVRPRGAGVPGRSPGRHRPGGIAQPAGARLRDSPRPSSSTWPRTSARSSASPPSSSPSWTPSAPSAAP